MLHFGQNFDYKAGWQVGKDRVQRIWWREGFKVPQKQRPQGRLWRSSPDTSVTVGSAVTVGLRSARDSQRADLARHASHSHQKT
jgi:hypothetical protein